MIRRLLQRLRLGPSAPETLAPGPLAEAAEKLEEFRGDKLAPQSAEHGASHSDDVAAAARDYGLSRFSGETDAIGKISSYRSSRKRRR